MSALQISNLQKTAALYSRHMGKYHMAVHFRGIRSHDINRLATHMHYHSDMEIIYVLAGKGLYTSGFTSSEIGAQDIHICHENVPHGIVSDPFKPLQYASFLLHMEDKEASLAKSTEDRLIDAFMKKHQLYAKKQPQIQSFFDVLDCHVAATCAHTWIISACIITMVLEMLVVLTTDHEPVQEEPVVHQETLDMATDYIMRNLHRHIYLKQIAEACYTSERNIQYLFRQKLNTGVVEYINRKKIETAKNYIRIRTSIKETAAMIGIEDPSRFTKLFKKHTGMTPGYYMKKYAEKSE